MRLGIMQRPRQKIRQIAFVRMRRDRFGVVHQLRDDLAEAMALVVDEMGHRLELRVG